MGAFLIYRLICAMKFFARVTLVFALSWLGGCAIFPMETIADRPAVTSNGTKDVKFVSAYVQESINGEYKLTGMVKDTRGRRHGLFDGHVDVQFINRDGAIMLEIQTSLRPIPRPRVIYRLARFSMMTNLCFERASEVRLFYREAEAHAVK